MKLRLMYFAELRERLERTEEAMALEHPISVADLIDVLRQRGGVWHSALASEGKVCVAVNQEMVMPTYQLRADAEVALFRPVTGG